MTARAVSLLALNVWSSTLSITANARPAAKIDTPADGFEVARVHAPSVRAAWTAFAACSMAEVIEVEPGWDRADSICVREAVCDDAVEAAVSRRRDVAKPRPAFVLPAHIHPRPEALACRPLLRALLTHV